MHGQSGRYASDQERAAKYFREYSETPIDLGDDPIGILIASHRALRAAIDASQRALEQQLAHAVRREAIADDEQLANEERLWLAAHLAIESARRYQRYQTVDLQTMRSILKKISDPDAVVTVRHGWRQKAIG